MAIYLGIHSGIEEMPEEKVDGAWEMYKDSCAKLDLKTHKMYYNLSEGKAFCVTEAPSKEKVQEAHDNVASDNPIGDLQILEIQTRD